VSLFVLKQKVTKKFKRNNPSTQKAPAGPELRFLPTDVPKYNFPEVKIFNQNQLRLTAPKRAE
jgi:hypothetical protein